MDTIYSRMLKISKVFYEPLVREALSSDKEKFTSKYINSSVPNLHVIFHSINSDNDPEDNIHIIRNPYGNKFKGIPKTVSVLEFQSNLIRAVIRRSRLLSNEDKEGITSRINIHVSIDHFAFLIMQIQRYGKILINYNPEYINVKFK